jgi:WD40 repeat protein
VFTAEFSPTGTCIATASWNETFRIWDAATRTEILSLGGHEDGLHKAVFSSDGTRIVTASGDRIARIWNAVTGAEILSPCGT